MVNPTPPSDAAISGRNEDELGRAPFAAHLAETVLEAPARDSGYVIGLTGGWGTGKTSVLNIVEEILDGRAYVVRFNPWMFSSADVLVVRFFTAIAQVLEAEVRRQEDAAGGGRGRRKIARAAKDATKPLRTVAEGMAKVGATAAPIASILLGTAAGEILGAPQRAFEQLGQPENNPEALRDHLRTGLSALDRKIVVFIDDLDRVGSREEVRELVRLVKLVGDLPGVVYLLSYETARVERALNDLDGKGGREYLEKVVQAPYDLPDVRPAQLHAYCSKQLGAYFDDKLIAYDEQQWAQLVPSIFAYLKTVRDVKRLINACILEMRLAGDEVASQDVIALAALRVFDRDVHSRLGDVARELTGRTSLLDFGGEKEQREETRRRIECVLENSEAPDVTRTLLSRLFPAAPLTNVIESADNRSWQAARRVASSAVLDTYLHASLDESRLATSQLNDILDALANRDEARPILDGLSPGQVSDLLDRIADHPERLPTDDAVGGALEILRLRPRLGERLGFGMPHEYKIMYAVNALLGAIPRDRRAGQVDEIVRRADNVSNAFMVLRDYGTTDENLHERRDPGLVYLPPKRTLELEDLMRERIRRRPGSLADEMDFGLFFSWLVAQDQLTLEAVREQASNNDRLFLKLLDGCVVHTRSSTPPYDSYELQFDQLEQWLGPVKSVAARASGVTVEQPTERLSAGLQQLAERADDV